MNKFKQCPFCNSQCELIFEKGELAIECRNCPASMRYFTEENEAINAWNKRCLTVFENEIVHFTNGAQMALTVLENYKTLHQSNETFSLLLQQIIGAIETRLDYEINP